jgi:hypothetical protein
MISLSSKFGQFRKVMRLDEMPEAQARFAQMCYLAGAQACFQILAKVAESDASAAEVQMAWASLQQEILAAAEKTKPQPVDVEEPQEPAPGMPN